MTAPKRSLLATCLMAAGLLTSAGVAQAADVDVSSIFGRGSPPNAHITHADQARASNPSQSGRDVDAVRSSADASTNAGRTTTSASDTVTVPTGHYLAVDEATRPAPFEAAVIHEEEIDGTPLVDGRGMREGVDYHAGPAITTDPGFDVADILGRASPPAPADAPNFGLHS